MKITAIILLSFFISFNSIAQLTGSGKIIHRSFDLKDFDKIDIKDFDGNIEIEIGKSFSIKIDLDDNLGKYLEVNKNDKESQLNIFLKGNTNGKMYLEDVNINIKITLPEASVISIRGNANSFIKGINGRYFRLENQGNGSCNITGVIDELDIKKSGNGDVNAKKLIAKTAKVKSVGNGNVSVYSQISLQGSGVGNGNIIQTGPGKIEGISGVIGNGEVKHLN